jgi:protoheme IX farnesyltransferase
MSDAVATAVAPATAAAPTVLGGRLHDYALLTKPRVALMALAAVGVGAACAASVAPVTAGAVSAALVGGGLVAAGATAWNQVLERKSDALMRRTMDRPLPTGRMSLTEARLVGGLLAVLGTVVLALWATPAAAIVGALTWAIYVFGYTPLKAVTALNTQVGAVAGALPPVLGWTAVTGAVEPGAMILFAILFLWQIPHVLALGAMYADQYTAAGIRQLPIENQAAAGRQAAATAMALIPAACGPALLGIAGPGYFIAAILLGLFYFVHSLRFALRPDSARSLLRASLVYLPVLFTCLVIDRWLGGAA